ncbi:TIGR03618 family F420-dependent PPOX class oxidoreductase [Nonomuraea phyllanthi]|uniref:TIGR03618 family F420-dependent PPOX class oxidoreductase n=1 Tax=Nonomuraea phyllanthi TaxID=2219224 RepID=A0A5C4VGG7_9ACTN|nr:PPOX class F420-dependent oxidoreductase [Nonomuraea phyllanthi]KAB8188786.1 TIGR03618 family F420-dependent PPOX class oxidoreductase [Nonomuraea phyllanthi]QFY05980.1 TIGR03618 family F420-dependent PPOX class oxidoreductase [Nonomuraea phyllanthi]
MAELSEDARKLLDAPNYATVTSINPDGGPQSTVVWVRTDGDDVLFSTVKGRTKPRNFERDPRASLLVIDPDDPYRYVEVRGRVTMTPDPSGALIEELSQKYRGRSWEDKPGTERLIVRISPERVTLRG